MKILPLTAFLVVMQAAAPVPRKAADASAGSRQQVETNAQANKTPADPRTPSMLKQPAPQNQDESHPPPTADARKSIIVCEAAPVTPAGADWWFRAYVVFTGLLVAIGAVGIGYAIQTLRAIERQAKANEEQLTEIQQSAEKTERIILLTAQQTENGRIATEAAKASADAAKASADAIINSERAWILVDLGGGLQGDGERQYFITQGSSKDRGDSTSVFADVILANEGRSPCWITDMRLKFEIVDNLPDVPNLESVQMQEDCIGTSFASEDTSKFVWHETFYGRANGKNMTVAYGIVKYRDIFGLSRSTTFGFQIVRDDLIGGHHYIERLSRLYPKYNEHT